MQIKFLNKTALAGVCQIVLFGLTGCGGSSGEQSTGFGNTVQAGTSQQQPQPEVQPQPGNALGGNNSAGLDRLLGTVTLRYSFSADTTVFESTARFTSGSYDVSNGSARLVASAQGKAIACSFSQVGRYDYTCFIARSTDGTGQTTSANGFLFNLDTATSGSGVFEFCNDAELDPRICVNELITNPDGLLTVTVNQFAKATETSRINNLPATGHGFQTYQESAEAEFGWPDDYAGKHIPSSVEVDELTEMLQRVVVAPK